MDAAARIRENCKVILKLEAENPDKGPSFLSANIGGKKLNGKAFIVMCSEFSIILNSGVPIARAVELIAGKMTDKPLKSMLYKIKEEVEAATDGRITVEIYTDGAARGNPNGPGGYGTVLHYTDTKGTLHTRELSQGYVKTTNNRMELTGVIEALSALKKPCGRSCRKQNR